MNKTILTFITLLALSSAAMGQKLYKIKDENGNVSFSQFPPVTKQENTTVEGVKVSRGSQTTITEEMDGIYCGDIRLMSSSASSSSKPSYIKNLERRRSSWRDQRDRLSKSIDNSNKNALKNTSKSYNRNSSSYQSKHFQQSIDSTGNKLRDIRCALSWADKELEGSADIIAKTKVEKSRLLVIQDELQTKLDRNCGDLPAYDPNRRSNDAQRKRWYNCSKDLRKEISLVKREISRI